MTAISVVIPMYNERNRIGNSIKTVQDELLNRISDAEIVFVDDGSTDDTVRIVEDYIRDAKIEMRLLREPHRGKGAAVRAGVLAAKGEKIVFSDADLSTPPVEFWKLLDALDNFHVAIASRRLSDSVIEVKQPWFRRRMGKIFSRFVSLFLLPGIKDSQCGCKAFMKNSAKQIFQKQKLDGFTFDVEVLLLARKFKLNITEVPVVWQNDPDSKVKMIRDGPKMFLDLVKLFFKYRLGGR